VNRPSQESHVETTHTDAELSSYHPQIPPGFSPIIRKPSPQLWRDQVGGRPNLPRSRPWRPLLCTSAPRRARTLTPHHSPVASTGGPGDQAAQPNLKLPPRVAAVHDGPRPPRSARTTCAAAGFTDVPHPLTRPRPHPLPDQPPHPRRARRHTSAPAPAPHTTTTPARHRRTHAHALPHAAPARARTRARPCRAPPPRLPSAAAAARSRRHRPAPPCRLVPPLPPPRPP
jgi:hypothetical protein